MTACPRTCHGGWQQVLPSYADHQQGPEPEPPAPTGDALTDALEHQRHELAMVMWHAERAALLRSVYPCRECRPDAFMRWAGRHWMHDHADSSCDECKLVRRGAYSKLPSHSPGNYTHPDEDVPGTDAEAERKDLA
jgi:hypothetical protein